MAYKDLTDGRVAPLLFRLALPVFASFLLHSIYGLADLYFVGLLGGEPLAALGIGLNAFFLVMAVGQTIGIGALASLSHAYGAKQYDQVGAVYRQAFVLMFVLGGTAWWAGHTFAGAYFSALTNDPVVHREGVAFFQVYAITFVTQLFLMVNGFCWRALGDFIIPTALMGTGVLLNVALDPLLIFGVGPFPELGVAGAAWATVLAQLLTGGVYWWLLLRGRPGDLLTLRERSGRRWRALWDRLRPRWETQWRLLRIGLPGGMQFFFFAGVVILQYRFVREFGADATGSVAVGHRIMHSAILPCVAISSALASVVGQNYGARDFARVKVAILWAGLYSTTAATLLYGVLYAAPEFWTGLFTNEPGVTKLGGDYLRIYGMVLPLNGLALTAMFTLQGLGRTVPALVAIAARFAAFWIVLLVLGAMAWLTPTAIFYAGALTTVLEVAIMCGGAAVVWRAMLAPPATGAAPPPTGERAAA